MPWPLDMANACINRYGDLLQFPRDGGWHAQDDEEVQLMQLAWYMKHLYQTDAKGKRRKWTANDADFLFWLEKPDSEVFDYEGAIKNEVTAV